jgi:hypothetical protein
MKDDGFRAARVWLEAWKSTGGLHGGILKSKQKEKKFGILFVVWPLRALEEILPEYKRSRL